MKRIVLAVTMYLLLCGLALAGGGLDGFLDNMNIQARTDMNGFSARVSTQCGVPGYSSDIKPIFVFYPRNCITPPELTLECICLNLKRGML